MLKRLMEAFDGRVLSLMSLFDLDTQPRRPGEPIVRSGGSSPFGMGVADADDPLGYNDANDKLYPNLPRSTLLDLYGMMDDTGLAGSVLDMQMEDVVVANPDTGKAIKIEGSKFLRDEVGRMFEHVGAENDLPRRVRAMLMNGSELPRLIYSSGEGVTHWVDTYIRDMDIVIDKMTRQVKGYKEKGHRFRINEPEKETASANGKQGNAVSYPWDYLHFKLTGKREDEPWGRSLLKSGVRPWQQMVMAEDAALLYRISRAPDRMVTKVDVGSMSEADAWNYVQEYKRRLRRAIIQDPLAGKMRQEYKPLGPAEDIFLGVRPDSQTSIDILSGSANTLELNDLGYYAKNFLHTTRTPPPVFGFFDESDTQNPVVRSKRATNQDIRYARHIIRVQKCVVETLMQLAKIHLSLRARNVEDQRYDWKGDPNTGSGKLVIHLQPPSFLQELERLEVMQLRANIATELVALGQSSGSSNAYEHTVWIYKHILRFDDETINKILEEHKEQDLANAAAIQGVRPTVSPATAKPRTAKKPRRPGETSAIAKAREGRADNADGNLNDRQIERLYEMMRRSPKIRTSVANLAMLFNGEGDDGGD